MIGQQLAPTPIRLVDLGIPCQITRIQWNPSLIETLIHSLFIRVSFFFLLSLLQLQWEGTRQSLLLNEMK